MTRELEEAGGNETIFKKVQANLFKAKDKCKKSFEKFEQLKQEAFAAVKQYDTSLERVSHSSLLPNSAERLLWCSVQILSSMEQIESERLQILEQLLAEFSAVQRQLFASVLQLICSGHACISQASLCLRCFRLSNSQLPRVHSIRKLSCRCCACLSLLLLPWFASLQSRLHLRLLAPLRRKRLRRGHQRTAKRLRLFRHQMTCLAHPAHSIATSGSNSASAKSERSTTTSISTPRPR